MTTSPYFTFAHSCEYYTTNTTVYYRDNERIVFVTNFTRCIEAEYLSIFYFGENCILEAAQWVDTWVVRPGRSVWLSSSIEFRLAQRLCIKR